MLYGTNASRESGDRDFDPTDVPGLAAITSSRRPLVVQTGGGGGIGVSGSGGGGAPGPGEAPVAGSRTRGIPVSDRNVSVPQFAAKGQARQAFAKSGRGSKLSVGQLRLSPISPVSTAWGGLSGLDDAKRDLDILTWAKDAPPTEDAWSGLGDFFSDLGKGLTRAFTPPPVVRKVTRYAGAATAAIFAPVLTGAQQRKIFGLNPAESAVFMKTQQASRIAIAAIATGGAAKLALAPAASPAPGSAAFMGPTLSPGAPAFMGPVAPTTASAGWQAPTIQELTSAPLGTPGVGMASSGYAAPLASPASGASEGYLAATGKGLVRGTGEVLKAIGIQAGAQAILTATAPKQNTPQEQAAQSVDMGTTSPGGFVAAPTNAAGQPTGGDSGSSSGEAPILAGSSPLVGLALAGVGLALLMGKSNIKRRGRK